MDNGARTIHSKLNAKIKCTVYPGHFATSHSHVNYYVDLTMVKVSHKLAKLAAVELAQRYRSVKVDTIICLEGTEMIGAFIADTLISDELSINAGCDIAVLEPEINANSQLIFRENTQIMVNNKRVLLLVSNASTGKTIRRALDCLQYYGGDLVGICTLFSVVGEMNGVSINSVFTKAELPDYQTFIPGRCDMCEQKSKIDAIANSFGFSRLN